MDKDEKEPVFSLAGKIIIGLAILLAMGLAIAFVVVVGRAQNYDPLNDAFIEPLLNAVNRTGAAENMAYLSSKPHIAGSDTNYETALYVKQQLENFGWPDVKIESYPVLINYPISRSIELTAPTYFKCNMTEAVVNDTTSGVPGAIDTFNGYGASGDASGPLIYVNYGRVEDFQWLDSQHVDFTGAIVIARYGNIFRGDKCAQGEARGAIGCIVYSDPADVVHGPVYTEGPWKPPTSVQRGSMWDGSGDPSTPGWPSSTKGPRFTVDECRDQEVTKNVPLPKIPILPIGYGDAEPLLAAMSGTKAPEDWQGHLNITYYVGPSPAVVHMKADMNFTIATIHNVLATIPGTVEPDRAVLFGAHRDAWTFGAADPISGTTSLLESARAFGAILQAGWQPRRTLQLCSWDAEEFALIGSVEYGETHFKTLTSKAVAYLNFDIAVSGTDFFAPIGTPNMKALLTRAAKLVNLPEKNGDAVTVYDLWAKAGLVNGSAELEPLGSGSDYGGFIQHIGVSSAHLQFTSADGRYQSVYHSNYDSNYYVTHFLDPDFGYHTAASNVMSLAVKGLVDSLIIPFDFRDYASALYDGTLKLNEGNVLTAQNISLGPLLDSVAQFTDVANAVATEIEQANVGDALRLRMLNDRLLMLERAFIDYNGLPGRTWFRHLVYAPSLYDSYEGVVFPTIADNIFTKNWKVVEEQIGYVSLFVDSATAVLRGDI